MILEITFNDFRFFDNGVLSFQPDARTKRLLSNSFEYEGTKVLKSLGIYSANNAGKSNLVNLFEIVKGVLAGNSNSECNRKIFGDNDTASFSITFNNRNGFGWLKYEYTYNSLKKSFEKEKLSKITFYTNGSPLLNIIFEKDIEAKKLNILGQDYSQLATFISSDRPILYALQLDTGTFESLSIYKKELTDAANSIEILRMYNIPINKTLETLKSNDAERKSFILSFVKNADLSVNDFYYDKDVKLLFQQKGIDEKALKNYEKQEDVFRLITRYNKAAVPSLVFDSTGTKKIEAIASYIYETLYDGKTLVVDEIDNGLHFHLTRSIVSAFNNIANERGQLVFTSHDLLLIDCNYLLRKDQIYFLERGKEKAKLFSLKTFPVSEGGPREGEELLKRYNHGDFGKVPSPKFVNEVVGIRDKVKRDGKV